MKWSFVVALAFVGLTSNVGCGSSQGNGDTGAQQSETDVDAGDQEPEGVAYPEGPFGYAVGSVIKNVSFQGYRLPVVDGGEKTLGTVSLSDFYDPQNNQYKLLHLSAGALWCTPCNDEADQLARISNAELSRGVVTIQAIIESAYGEPSTVDSLDTWIARHNIKDFSVVLDSRALKLGRFFSSGEIPWNAYVDVRTMTILYSNVGFNGGIGTEDSKWLDYVASHPPQ